MEKVSYRSGVSVRFFTILSIVIIGVLASASQSMGVGDYGEECTSEMPCYLGLYCNNSASLCERCGGSGEPKCPGEPCVEGPGWVPVPYRGDDYCIYLADDYQFRQNCSFSGYLMCPGSNTCRGLSIPLPGTRLCVDCGILGQRCCEGNSCPQEMNAVCKSGRCRPPDPPSSGSHPNNKPTQNGEKASSGGIFRPSGMSAAEWQEYLDSISVDKYLDTACTPRDQLPKVCKSKDGRHETCRKSGCNIPDRLERICLSKDGRNVTCQKNGCNPVFTRADGSTYRIPCYWKDRLIKGIPCYWETIIPKGEKVCTDIDQPPCTPRDQLPKVCKSKEGRHETCRKSGCNIPDRLERICLSKDGRNVTCQKNGCNPVFTRADGSTYRIPCYWKDRLIKGIPCYWETIIPKGKKVCD